MQLLERALNDTWMSIGENKSTTNPKMLGILDASSNFDETAIEVMRLCIDATKYCFGDNSSIFASFLIADKSCFLCMCRELHDAPPGQQKTESDNLVIIFTTCIPSWRF